MEGSFQQTSFIPKKPIIDGSGKPHHSTSILAIIAGVVFVTILALAAGVYAYKYFLDNSIEDTKNQLRDELSKLNNDNRLAGLTRLDKRLNSTKQLLDQHLSLSGLFTVLGETTLKSVRYTSFSYGSGPANSVIVTMSGLSPDFASAARQSLMFVEPESRQYFKNTIISNLNLDPAGNVAFSVKTGVIPDKFRYSETLDGFSGIESFVSLSPAGTSVTASSTSAQPKP